MSGAFVVFFWGGGGGGGALIWKFVWGFKECVQCIVSISTAILSIFSCSRLQL